MMVRGCFVAEATERQGSPSINQIRLKNSEVLQQNNGLNTQTEWIRTLAGSANPDSRPLSLHLNLDKIVFKSLRTIMQGN